MDLKVLKKREKNKGNLVKKIKEFNLMKMNLHATFYIWVIFSGVILPATVVICDFPTTLNLHRAIPLKERVELSQLRAHDRARHGRVLQSVNGVVDFPVSGTFNPYRVG